jgi:glycosyltransferase involved in cell wall biosynthesis
MAKQGHDVTVFCRKQYSAGTLPPHPRIRLRHIPTMATKHLEAITHTAACLPGLCSGFDVVHVHATGPSLLSWVPRLFGRKVVVTVHGMDYRRGKWGRMAKLVLRAGAWTAANCPDETIVVSRELRTIYEQEYGRETTWVPNGVSRPLVRPLVRLKKLGLARGKYVLSLGRLVPEKGLHTLIEAFRGLDRSSDVKLVIAGGSSHSDGYVDHLKELAGDDERIMFVGPLYGADKDEAFSNAALFAMPSELEGMPITLLEAMSYGCPVLASDIPECREVCEAPGLAMGPGQHACATFACKDASDLRAKLEETIADPLREARGRHAQRHVLQTYNWDAITERTLQVYSRSAGDTLFEPDSATSPGSQ